MGAGQRDVFFVHVMKTGGTSVSVALTSTVADRRRVHPFGDRRALTAGKVSPDELLSRPRAELDVLEVVSVHMPAWLAHHVRSDMITATVLRDPVERTVSHLRQIAGHPDAPDDLAEVWADPGWRSRLEDYQTQLFAASPDDVRDTSLVERTVELAESDEALRASLADGVRRLFWTGLAEPMAVDAAVAEVAMARLERFDVVGVTDRLDDFAERLATMSGRALPATRHLNPTPSAEVDVDPMLLEDIERATVHDRALVQRARELSKRPASR